LVQHLPSQCQDNIVTHMTIAKQMLGKHIPEVTLSTIEGHPFLSNETINIYSSQQKRCFLCVSDISIVRQRLGKHVPAEACPGTVGRPFLDNGAVNSPTIFERRCFPWGPSRGCITRNSK
jgi:hypothetical protein